MTDPLETLADELWQAQLSREPIPQPSTGNYPDLDIEGAYAVQTRNLQRRISAGEVVVGRKIGLTSRAMQQQLGVDQPDYGAITDRMVIANGGEVDLSELIAPRVEPEFAFRIGRELSESPTLEEVRGGVDAVAVSAEIIDSRVSDWMIGLVDTIADNASSARIVVGPWQPATPERLAATIDTTIALERDGEVIDSGAGAEVLGDPIVALHWLASAIGKFGNVLKPGDTVLAGAVTGAVTLTAGSTWSVTAPGYEPARFTTSS